MPLVSAPAEIAFTCLQGSPFEAVLQFFQDEGASLPVDFTGYRFDMQIREGVADASAPIVASLTSEGSDARIFFIGEATDGTPDIEGTADPENGFIYLHLHSDDTSAITPTKAPKSRNYPVIANFYFDIEATPPGGEPQRIAFGTFDLNLEITRVV